MASPHVEGLSPVLLHWALSISPPPLAGILSAFGVILFARISNHRVTSFKDIASVFKSQLCKGRTGSFLLSK